MQLLIISQLRKLIGIKSQPTRSKQKRKETLGLPEPTSQNLLTQKLTRSPQFQIPQFPVEVYDPRSPTMRWVFNWQDTGRVEVMVDLGSNTIMDAHSNDTNSGVMHNGAEYIKYSDIQS